MSTAKIGDKVKVHYTGKLKDGEVFDSSADREPIEFTLGKQEIIPGFEDAVKGMEEGEKKTEEINSDKAYGPYRDDMLMDIEKKQLPEDLEPKSGQHLEMQLQDGQRMPVVIKKVEAEKVTIDANHPLAGKDLVFDIQLVAIS